MMASLYQRRSFPASVSPLGGDTVSVASWSMPRIWSGEVIEVALGSQPAAQAQHVRGTDLRIELDVVAWPAPEVPRVGEQIVRLEHFAGIDAQLDQIQVDPARLRVMRIEVDDHQHRARAVGRGLAVADELVVVDHVKAQVPVELQRRVRVPRRVHPGDEITKAVGPVQVSMTDLVFFGIEILFAVRLARPILTQLERRSIDAVIRAQRR